MSPAPKHSQQRGRDGFIIVAVMWILIALAALASIYSTYVSASAVALSVNDDKIYSDALVSAALELTAYQMSAPNRLKRPSRGAFRFRLEQATVAVDFLPENARIDLNAAPKEMLAGLFAVLGSSAENANAYADRIIGWRTRPKSNEADNEDALYRTAGLRYSPRGGLFNHVNELWLVQGIPPALVARAMNFVTVYSGQPGVDVLNAAPEVIAALPGMTPGRLNSFLDQRETMPPDPQRVAGALGAPDRIGVSTKGSDTIRVNVRINYDKGRQSASEVVILIGTDDAPLHVLSWRDSTDATSARVADGTGVQ
jgi:general secretion pathway protein K